MLLAALVLATLSLAFASAGVVADETSVGAEESIQDAIDESDPGDTIVVEAGTYEENLTVDVEDLTLAAADGDRPVLDGGDSVNQSLNVSADGVVVDGFDVRNYNQTDYGYGPPPVVRLAGDGVELRNATITDNEEVETVLDVTGDGSTVSDVTVDGHDSGLGTDARAIRIDAHDVMVSNPTVTDNDAGIFAGRADGTVIEGATVESTRDRGIELQEIDGFEIRDSTIVDNDEEGIYQTTGVSRLDVYHLTVRNTSVVGNGDGVYISGGKHATFENNTIAETTGGISLNHNATIADNTLEDNTMSDFRTGGISVGSDSTITDNEVTDVRGAGISAGENSTVGNNAIHLTDGEQTGIEITGHGNVVTDNEVSLDRSGVGMTITNGAGATVTDNALDNGIVFTGHDDQAALADEPHEMENNVVDGDDLYYAANEDDPEVDPDAAQVILVNVTDATVSGFAFEGVASEVQVAHSDGVEITDNEVTDADPVAGTLQPSIGLWGTTNAIVSDNAIGGEGSVNQPDPLPNDRTGVHVGASENVSVENNELFGALGGEELGAGTTDDHGVHVAESDAVDVEDTVVDGFTSGVEVRGSADVTVQDSTITDVGPGVDARSSDRVDVRDNAIEDVEEGIYFGEVEQPVADGNAIQEAESGGIEGRDGHGFEIVGNEIADSGWGIDLRDVDDDTRSTISSNHVSDSDSGSGLFLEAWANVWDLENVSVTENVFEDNAGAGVVVDDPVGDDVALSLNSISGNQAGLEYDGDSALDATDNWWGDESGPGGDVEDPETGAVADGDGDEILSTTENVTFGPWLEVDPADGVEAAFGFDPAMPDGGEEIAFDAGDSASMGEIETYRWDFTGDGEVDETTSDEETAWTYDDEGTYEVTLAVEDEYGLTDEVTETVSVGGLGSCTEIDESGAYELAGDVVGESTCIEITADDVTLDGNGHAIEGAELVDGDQIGISVEGADNVTVRNLTVSGWDLGLEYRDADDGAVEDVVTEHSFNGFDLRNAHDNEVRNLTSRHHDNEALVLGPLSGESTTGNTFTNVTAYDNERNPASGFVVGAVYVGQAASDNEFVGLTSSESVAGVRTAGNVGTDANRFEDVTADDNDQYGLTLEADTGDVFENVSVSGNDWHGIELDDTRGNELANVTATENDGTAIYLHGGSFFNTLESVTVADTDGSAVGLSGADSNEFVDLDLRRNAGSTIDLSQDADGNAFEDVTVADAGLHGIAVSENAVTETAFDDVYAENVSTAIQIRGEETTVTNLTAIDSSSALRTTTDATDTRVTDVTAQDVGTGVFLAGEGNNTISDVSIDGAVTGVGIGSGETNTVTSATVANADVDVEFGGSAEGRLEQAVLGETTVSATGVDARLNATDEPETLPESVEPVDAYVEATATGEDAELSPLTLHYDEADLGEADPDSLGVWRYDGEWSDPMAEPYYTERNVSEGYVYAFGASEFDTSTFGVFGAAETDPVELGTLAGEVTDENGTTLEDAEVLAVGQDVAEGNVTTTDGDGVYDTTLPAGTYEVTISAPDHLEKTVTDVEVTAEETTDLDVELEAIPDPGTLTGVLESETPEPLQPIPIEATDRTTGETWTTTSTYSLGTYTLELPPGTYDITFVGDVHGYESKTVENVTIDEDETTELDATLEEPEHPPEGSIELEEPIFDGQETATVDYAFENATDDEATVVLGVEDGDPEDVFTEPVTENGSLSVELDEVGGVEAGDELVAMLWDDIDDSNGFQPPIGAEPVAEDAVVVDDEPDPEGSIEGTITDANTDDPVDDADVVLFDNESAELLDDTTTGADGAYAFESLEDGTYDLTVSADEYETGQVNGLEVVDGDTETRGVELDPIAVLVEIEETNAPVVEGETLSVNVSVENAVDETISETIEVLDTDDALVANETVDLDGGETETLSLEWETDVGDAGDHVLRAETSSDVDTAEVTVEEFVPATFELSVDETNSPVDEGETVAVDATVENVGTERGNETVELRDENESVLANETVELDAGADEAVTLEWETDEDDIGQYHFSLVAGNASVDVPVAVEEIDLGLSATPSEPELGETVAFSAMDAENPTWDFGDGETATGTFVFHEYEAEVGELPFGTRTVNVTDEDGTEDTIEVEIPQPTITWDPQPIASTSIEREYGSTPLSGVEWEETFTARLLSADTAGGAEAVDVEEFVFELGDETITRDPQTDGLAQEAEATFDLGELDDDEILSVTATTEDGGEWEMAESVSVIETPDWLENVLVEYDVEIDQDAAEIVAKDTPVETSHEYEVSELPIVDDDVEVQSLDIDSEIRFTYDAALAAGDIDGDGSIDANLLGITLDAEVEGEGSLDSDLELEEATIAALVELSGIEGDSIEGDFEDAPATDDPEASWGMTYDPRVEFEGTFDEDFEFEYGTVQPGVAIHLTATAQIDVVGIGSCGSLAQGSGDVEASFDVGEDVELNLGGEATFEGGIALWCGPLEFSYDLGPYTGEVAGGSALGADALAVESGATDVEYRATQGTSPLQGVPSVDEGGQSGTAPTSHDGDSATDDGLERLTNRTAEDTQPAIETVGDDRVVVWSAQNESADSDDGRDLHVRTQDAEDGTWSDVESLTESAGHDEAPALGSTGDELLAAWVRFDEDLDEDDVDEPADVFAHADVAYAVGDGEDWSEPTVVDRPEDGQFGPSVATTDDGWLLAWESAADGTHAVEYTVVDADGENGSVETVPNATRPVTGSVDDGASIAYVDRSTDEVVTAYVDGDGLDERHRHDAGTASEVSTADSRTVWTNGTSDEPRLYEGDADGVSELTLDERVSDVSELALTVQDDAALVTYRAQMNDGASHELGYRLDHGDGWTHDREYAGANDANHTAWHADVTPAADGEGFHAAYAIQKLEEGAVNDVFVADHEFRPAFDLSANAGEAAAGENATISYDLANVGDVATDEAFSVVVENASEAVAEIDHDALEASDGALEAGETVSKELEVPVDAYGAFDLHVEHEGETHEGTEEATVVAATPALSVDSVSSERVDDGVEVTAEVGNDGAAAATDVPIVFENGTDVVADATVADTAAASDDRIDPGENATATTVIADEDLNATLLDRVGIDASAVDEEWVDRGERPTWFAQPDLDVGTVEYVEDDENVTAEVLVANRGTGGADATVSVADENGSVLGEATEYLANASASSPTFANVSIDLGETEAGADVVVTADADVPDADASTTGVSDEVGPLYAGDRPAFGVEIAAVHDEVPAGEDLLVEVGVENRGDAADAQTINLSADGEEADGADVELEPGFETTETLVYEIGEDDGPGLNLAVTSETDRDAATALVERTDDESSPGGAPAPSPPAPSDDPASFTVDAVDAPDAVDEDAPLSVSATVENVGEVAGSETVTLLVDGEALDEAPVELDGDETDTVDLSVPDDALDPGEHELVVAVGDDEETSTLRVSETETDDGEADDADDDADDESIPGFGAIVALVALALALVSRAALAGPPNRRR